MAFVEATNRSFSVKAYVGDKKTLLAFNFQSKDSAKNLAGFTIHCQPPGGVDGYFLMNQLQFEDPSRHKQVEGEKPNSSVNAPIQKFRWTHYPGTAHQGTSPALGEYTFTVTPRYFDDAGAMLALDPSLGVSVKVNEGPFKKGALSLGFSRGYMQSGAYVHNFGRDTPVVPKTKDLDFDTSAQAGINNKGQPVTFAQIYSWMGETAREQIFALLDRVLKDSSLTLKVFAYDLNEPDIVKALLTLAEQGRVRIILDNSSEHATQPGDPQTAEDQFADRFEKQKTGKSGILRGSFARFSHDKVFIVLRNDSAIEVLSGSTNFSLTGLYVNANHVLVFEDANVAGHYDEVFEQSWQTLNGITKWPSKPAAAAFGATDLATKPYQSRAGFVPKMQITFSPHTAADAEKILGAMADRIMQETHAARGNVIFAVMQIARTSGAVCEALGELHEKKTVFSYGISDAPKGIFLYTPGQATGVQVTGKPSQVTLPAPFDQVPKLPGHEIHDKFVVCGLNGSDPVVYCGSSNLALLGEEQNGDNLLAIHDADVATAFAIEALGLIDHYNFLDRMAKPKTTAPRQGAPRNSPAKKAAATTGAAANRASPKKAASAKKAPTKASARKTVKKAKAAAKKTVAKKKVATKAAKKKVTKKTKSAKRAPRR
ncbi:phospholipase D-like domain-containing protein [Bradyrhizobium sp. STM 3557]|uniref:phospholipase D-like domain-containing protein n=1 Tax=Bradyrhizobium sp. STM 3557 TaxID=578920 RepID=UPI003890701A